MPIKSFLKNLQPFLFVIIFASCTTSKNITVPEPEPEPVIEDTFALLTDIDSMSYSIGVQVAGYYMSRGMDTVNFDALIRGYQHVYSDTTLLINEEESNMTIQEKLQQFMTRKLNKEKEKGKAFLDSNALRPNVTTLPSGLQYEIIKRGEGPVPSASDKVSAHYVGTLLDGTEFDNSHKRGQPLEIPVTGVIAGWVEALQLMPVGSEWKLFIPSDLAYGDRGAGGSIPGGATLVFTIELLDIVTQ